LPVDEQLQQIADQYSLIIDRLQQFIATTPDDFIDAESLEIFMTKRQSLMTDIDGVNHQIDKQIAKLMDTTGLHTFNYQTILELSPSWADCLLDKIKNIREQTKQLYDELPSLEEKLKSLQVSLVNSLEGVQNGQKFMAAYHPKDNAEARFFDKNQ
jgi:division protein CdvB (Snf7/Vps24/ESCRT-III family)